MFRIWPSPSLDDIDIESLLKTAVPPTNNVLQPQIVTESSESTRGYPNLEDGDEDFAKMIEEENNYVLYSNKLKKYVTTLFTINYVRGSTGLGCF